MGAETSSEIRDLIEQLRNLAQNHRAYAQVSHLLYNTFDHMAAIARCEENNKNKRGDE